MYTSFNLTSGLQKNTNRPAGLQREASRSGCCSNRLMTLQSHERSEVTDFSWKPATNKPHQCGNRFFTESSFTVQTLHHKSEELMFGVRHGECVSSCWFLLICRFNIIINDKHQTNLIPAAGLSSSINLLTGFNVETNSFNKTKM